MLACIKSKIKKVTIITKNLCFALKVIIKDKKIESEMNSPRKLRSGFIETIAYITESKYKSQLITMVEENGRVFLIIQECKREGKIINGIMKPEPIERRYLKIDARNSFHFIKVFRDAGYLLSKSIKKSRILK